MKKLSNRQRKERQRAKILKFLAKVRKEVTYGEVADAVGIGSGMAVGQILKAIVNENPKDKKLTKKVVAAA
jgi:alkylated DNA nucleotide flippase Atl1